MECIFCSNASSERKDKDNDNISVDCQNCGHYLISDFLKTTYNSDYMNKNYKTDKHLVSGFIRESNIFNIKIPLLTTENIDSFILENRIPRNITEKADKILKYIESKTTFFGEEIEVFYFEKAISYSIHENELLSLLTELERKNLLLGNGKTNMSGNYSLTFDGVEYLNKVKRSNNNYKKAFVAMWFSEEMINIYNEYIKSAIEESGYRPLIISEKEHLNDITDEIITEIRQSKFIISDLTGSRGGVYFEAGFAYGLGIPVIWTCKSDWFKKENIHFDVEHFPFIIWKDGIELKSKIINRIRATIET